MASGDFEECFRRKRWKYGPDLHSHFIGHVENTTIITKSTSVDGDSLGGSKRHKHKQTIFCFHRYFRTNINIFSQMHATSNVFARARHALGNEVDYPPLCTNIL